MLYKYRYKNRKDYYQCNLKKIKTAFKKCIQSIKCVENQIGGNIINTPENKIYKITYYEKKTR